MTIEFKNLTEKIDNDYDIRVISNNVSRGQVINF